MKVGVIEGRDVGKAEADGEKVAVGRGEGVAVGVNIIVGRGESVGFARMACNQDVP